jgi:hypothetical protein
MVRRSVAIAVARRTADETRIALAARWFVGAEILVVQNAVAVAVGDRCGCPYRRSMAGRTASRLSFG